MFVCFDFCLKSTISYKQLGASHTLSIDGRVYLASSRDRQKSILALLERVDLSDYRGKQVALKANFNSADPFPASTHPETLRVLVESIKKAEPSGIILAERSGMGRTSQVLDKLGVYSLSRELGFKVKVLEESSHDEWTKIDSKGTHWLSGFYISKVFTEAPKVVQTCCLKTHRFGGQFTMSLKNSVGMVAKKLPNEFYDYMYELHLSPNQRKMIAEINAHYRCDFVLMDASKAFTSGGPDKGSLVEPGLILAAKDRVAIDAVGAAILQRHGARMQGGSSSILELDQLKRAVELGIGVKRMEEIQLIPLDDYSSDEAKILMKQYFPS